MICYQCRDYGQPLEAIEAPTPEPAGSELLMRVDACGACHSDVHVWEGEYDMGGGRKLDVRTGRALPFTLGHEIVGEVLAMGTQAWLSGTDPGLFAGLREQSQFLSVVDGSISLVKGT